MRLMRSRPFALLFAGYAINAIGSWATLVAMWGFAAYRFHSGPGDIALIGLAWAVPAAVLTPVAGVPIDRVGPRRVLIVAYTLGSAASLAMAFAGSLHQLMLLGCVHGAVEAFARPAGDVLAPRLVADEDLLAANALLGSAWESSIVFGPLVAAGAIAAFGLRGAFVVDAATFWVGVAVIVPLQLAHVARERPAPFHRELVEGLSLARRRPVLRYTLVLSAACFLTWGTFMVVEPIYVRDVLHRPPTTFALLQVVFGVGLVGTGLLLPRLGDRVATPRALAASVLLSGAAAATYIGTRWVPVAFAGVFLWGVDVAFFSAPSRTLLQRGAPAWAHGRVLALNRALHSWSDVVALPVAGTIAGAVGVRPAGLGVAAIAALAGAVGLVVRPASAAEPVPGRDGDGDGLAAADQAPRPVAWSPSSMAL